MRPSSLIPCALLATGLLLTPSWLVAQSPITTPPPLVPPVTTGPRVFVGDTTADTIFVLQDLDTDGNANGIGEAAVFYDDTSPGPDLGTPRFVAFGPDGALYVGDSSGDFILRLEDQNSDGDANDAGEFSIFYDALSGGPPLVSINNIVFDGAGYLYYSDNGTSTGTVRTVVRLRDDNSDGTCLAADGEVQVIYDFDTTTGIAIERPSGLAIDADGTLLVSDYETDSILRLVDTTGSEDGDASDAGEQLPYFASMPGGVELNFSESIGFAPPATPGGPTPTLYVNGGSVLDQVFRFHDADASGTIDNPGEIGVFWDITQADGIIPAVAFKLAVDADGSLFVTEGGQSTAMVPDQIVHLRDLNADLDANDAGEATIFFDNSNASGIAVSGLQPIAVEAQAPLPPQGTEFVRGDCNTDQMSNIADAVFLLGYLFPGQVPSVPTCDDACDANDDEQLNIADAIALLASLFGMPAVPLPEPISCGLDPDGDMGALDCDSFPGC